MADENIIKLYPDEHDARDLMSTGRKFAESPADQASKACVMALQEYLMSESTNLQGLLIIAMDKDADQSINIFTPSSYETRGALAATLGYLEMAKDIIKDEAEAHLMTEISEDDL
jgi:hypothetical protein